MVEEKATGQLRYRGPDQANVPLLGRTVEPDELVEVPVEWLDPRVRAWSPDLWEVVDDGGAGQLAHDQAAAAYRSRTVDELRAELAARPGDLPTEGLKDELVERLLDDDAKGEA